MRRTTKNLLAAGIAILIAAMVCAANKQNGPSTQVKNRPPAAPVPVAILHSTTIFISNVGTGCEPFAWQLSPVEGYTDGSVPAYDEFYNAMKDWGHYELAAAPGSAQLAFEISFSCPLTMTQNDFTKNYRYLDPQLRLVIRDVKTNVVLWEITEHVGWAAREQKRAANLLGSAKKLLQDVERLLGTSADKPTS